MTWYSKTNPSAVGASRGKEAIDIGQPTLTKAFLRHPSQKRQCRKEKFHDHQESCWDNPRFFETASEKQVENGRNERKTCVHATPATPTRKPFSHSEAGKAVSYPFVHASKQAKRIRSHQQ
jgi:hypothetical protein